MEVQTNRYVEKALQPEDSLATIYGKVNDTFEQVSKDIDDEEKKAKRRAMLYAMFL